MYMTTKYLINFSQTSGKLDFIKKNLYCGKKKFSRPELVACGETKLIFMALGISFINCWFTVKSLLPKGCCTCI